MYTFFIILSYLSWLFNALQFCVLFHPVRTEVHLQSNYFGEVVGTKSSQNNFATIIIHQWQANRQASYELFLGVIGSTRDPNQLKSTPPITSSHTTPKHIKQLKGHNFGGTTLSQWKKASHEIFWGVISSTHHPNQITPPPLTLSHTTPKHQNNKTPQTPQVPQFSGNYSPK